MIRNLKKLLAISIASDLFTSFFFDNSLDNKGYISIAFVRLESFDELINSKCFFHFEGLTKKMGKPKAAHMPFIAPKV